MRRFGKVLLVILLATSLALVELPTSHASFSRVTAITLNTDENNLGSAVIDPAAGFAYFGTGWNSGFLPNPGIIVKLRLSDFSRVGALTLNSGEAYLRTAVIDPTHGFAYFGLGSVKVVRIRLSDFSRVDTLTGSGGFGTDSMVIDAAGNFAYIGDDTIAAGTVTKIRLSDFTNNASLTLNSGEGALTTAVIDSAAGFAYFGTSSSPGIIVKVKLSDMTRVGAIPLNAGENSLSASVIDPAGGFVYFGTNTSPSVIVKVRLSDFTRNATLSLGASDSMLSGAVIDSSHSFAYFGSAASAPGEVLKVQLSDMTLADKLTLNAGETTLRASIFDPTTAFAYFGTGASPARVVKIQTATIPGSPSGLTATGGAGKVDLTWVAPSANGGAPISGYNVYRGTSSGSETRYKSLGNVLTYTDNAVTTGVTYFYKVSANNTAGEGGFSNEASAGPSSGGSLAALPAQPTLLTIPLAIAAIAIATRKRAIHRQLETS